MAEIGLKGAGETRAGTPRKARSRTLGYPSGRDCGATSARGSTISGSHPELSAFARGQRDAGHGVALRFLRQLRVGQFHAAPRFAWRAACGRARRARRHGARCTVESVVVAAAPSLEFEAAPTPVPGERSRRFEPRHDFASFMTDESEAFWRAPPLGRRWRARPAALQPAVHPRRHRAGQDASPHTRLAAAYGAELGIDRACGNAGLSLTRRPSGS